MLRALAAAVTLGTGASLGPEGPSVDIGRSAARALGSVLRSKTRRLLPLIAAGSGAGAHARCLGHSHWHNVVTQPASCLLHVLLASDALCVVHPSVAPRLLLAMWLSG